MLNILLIEDDALYRLSVSNLLKGHSIIAVDSYNEAINNLSQNQSFDIALVDINLGKNNKEQGLKLIPILRERGIYVVIMSGYSEKHIIEKAFDLGCQDYFEKGSEAKSIKNIFDKYISFNQIDLEKVFFKENFITFSDLQKSLIKKSFPIITSDTPIFINGETGSGKTHLANALHAASHRSGIFAEISCANFDETELESELFGHEKSTFPAATEKKIGIFEESDNGTVFLDDIAAISLSTQGKILKALEEQKFVRLGGSKAIKSNFRIISACFENLQELVDQKKFRKDLFYRLAGISIYLLPLRERPEDIIPLMDFYSAHKKLSFTKDAKEELLSYSWPGNIRELNAFASYLTKTSHGRTSKDDITEILSNIGQPKKHKFITKELMDYAKNHGLQQLLAMIEREVTRESFQQNNDCMTDVLGELKISRRQFYRAIGDIESARLENGENLEH